MSALTSIQRDTHKPRFRLAAITLATALIAGLSAGGASLPAVAAPKTVPLFDEAGLATDVFTDTSKWIHGEAWVETSVDTDKDGKLDLIHLDYNIPGETATEGLKVPSVIEMSPYFAGTASLPNFNTFHEIGEPPALYGTSTWSFRPPTRDTSPIVSTARQGVWTPKGFATVHAEVLGTGYSEGCPLSGGPDERTAGKAVIQWLTGDAKAYTSKDRTKEIKADWSTGKAGMIGTSYPGMTAALVASTGVKGLEAIVPYSGPPNWYEYYRAGGAPRNPAGYAGEDLLQHATAVYSRIDDRKTTVAGATAPTPLICDPVFQDLEDRQDRVTGDYGPVWEERNTMRYVDNFNAAILLVQGFSDWNVKPAANVKLYQALKAAGKDVRFYLHQLAHTETGPTVNEVNAFFSHYLYGVKNNASENKVVVANSKLSGTNAASQVYETYPYWPIPGTSDVNLNLVAANDLGDGDLVFQKNTSNKIQAFVDDTRTDVTSGSQVVDGVRYLGSGTNADLAYVTTDATSYLADNRLIYTTPTLNQDVRLSGTPKLKLHAAVVNKTKATLSALLAYIPATGNARVVSRGWIDVENRNSISVTDPITAGQFYDFPIEFEPQDYIAQKGGRLALVVLASDPGYTLRPLPGTTIAVRPDKTTLTLQVVDGAPKLQSAVGFFSDVATVIAKPSATTITEGEWVSLAIDAATTRGEHIGDVSDAVTFSSTVASDTFADGIITATELGERTITISLGSASTQFKLTVKAKAVTPPVVDPPKTVDPPVIETPPPSVQKTSVKVSFKVNGGKALAKTSQSKTVTAGEKVGALPTPKRTGYLFKGWYTKKSGGTKVTSASPISKATILYAHWKKGVKTGTVSAAKLTVHKSSSASSKALGQFHKGWSFKILKTINRKGTKNDWYQVKAFGKTAYVSTKNVKVTYK